MFGNLHIQRSILEKLWPDFNGKDLKKLLIILKNKKKFWSNLK